MIDVLGVLVSAYTDARWGEIYEWVTLPLLFLGGILTGHPFIYLYTIPAAYFSIKKAGGKKIFASMLPLLFLDTILVPDAISLQILGMILLGTVMYIFGEIGGGDVLLWAALVPYLPTFLDIPMLLFLIPLSLLLSTLFYAIYFGAEKKLLVAPLFFLRGLSAFIYAIFLLLYATNMGNKLYVKKKIFEVQPEDIIIVDGKRMTVNREDIERLREKGIKEVYVLEGAPRLGPFIALAYLLLKFVPFTSTILVSLFTFI